MSEGGDRGAGNLPGGSGVIAPPTRPGPNQPPQRGKVLETIVADFYPDIIKPKPSTQPSCNLATDAFAYIYVSVYRTACNKLICLWILGSKVINYKTLKSQHLRCVAMACLILIILETLNL